jgi:hypothetical protein
LTHRDQDEQQPEQQLQHADPRGRLAVVGRVGRRGEREHDHADGPEPDEPTEHDAGPFTRGCGVTSIKITAMIGTGLERDTDGERQDLSYRLAPRVRRGRRSGTTGAPSRCRSSAAVAP